MSIRTLELFLRDLNEEGRKKVLEYYGIDTPEDANWEIIPLVFLEYDPNNQE